MAKQCIVCGQALSEFRRSNRRYCSGHCRVRAFRIRTGVGSRGRYLHREQSHRATKVVGSAAAGLALVALEYKRQQEQEIRQCQERLIADLSDKLDHAQQARDSALQEAKQLRDAAETRQQQLQQAREQNQKLQAAIQQMHEDLSHTQKRLNEAGWEFKELHAEWNGAEQRCAEAQRELDAYRATRNGLPSLPRASDARHLGQLQKARERNRELGQQVSQLQGRLAESERQHAQMELPLRREAALFAQVAALQGQLKEAQGQTTSLHDKVKRLKKRNARLLEQTGADDPPSTRLGGPADVLGVLGAGVILGRAAKQLELKPKRPTKRLLEPHAELNPGPAARRLPAKRT